MPSSSQIKLAEKIFSDAAERSKFLDSLERKTDLPAALVWKSSATRSESPFSSIPMPDAFPDFVQLVDRGEQPGTHSLHDQGAYYILDPSSVWESLVLCQVPGPVRNLLDVCAAPGGKSVLASAILKPQMLVANEVVQNRLRILISNMKRMNLRPVRVLSADVEPLAQRFFETMDLVLVDAPCSGQSLKVKGKSNPGAFHSSTISGNAKRQKRIIAEAGKCVSPGGYLAYMTCTFSPDENEKIIEWFLKRFPDFECVEVTALQSFKSTLSETVHAYRFWPHQAPLAGGFTCLLRKNGTPGPTPELNQISCAWKADD